MYLKRLDVHGFKSFGNKTQLQFAPGVTCVVGPNGTGKTNVADALRWVLGEHASRTLRARKTEDVIFAGSDKRAPLGIAEVSITLDNSGHWLPVEYDEVVVTRRAYRSGENEYLINNAKVRLRDVVELFMRAQVGQNSYAFMGQGMVEQVLSLRPEDRRALIEEAADVRLYRNKLEDAQTKLKQTRENVDRVRLLIREIEPRINQLERQAGRAVKYQELTRELAATLHVWYAHQWQDVNDLLLAAITTHDQRAEEFDRVKSAAKACEDGLVQLRAAIDERKNEIGTRDGRLRSLQDYARDLERRVALDGEREKMLAERVEELSTEIASLRADEAAQATATPISDAGDREALLTAQKDDLSTQRARLTDVEQELQRLQRSALKHEQTASRSFGAVEDLARRIQESVDAIARLRRERDASIEDRRKAINDLAAWARGHAHLSRDLSLAGPQLDWAIADRAREDDALGQLRRDQLAMEEELRAMRQQLESVTVRLEVMEELDVRPQAPDSGVRSILEAGGVIKRETVPADFELRGVVGLIGHLLRVPPGLEKAVEAALAENLFAVVMERESDVRAAVALLLAGDAGRATIYALDNFQDTRPLHLIKERGIIGVASGLVKCDSKYRRLIDTLLGRTVIVEDLALAHRVVRRGLAGAVATLDGVLVRPIGAVTAGTTAGVQASFVREREVGELPLELARLRPLIDEREAGLRESARAQESAQAKLLELSANIETLRDRKNALSSELSAAKAGLGAFRTQLLTLARGERERAEQIEQLQAQRDRADADRALRETEARDATAAEHQERDAMVQLEAERVALAATIGEGAAEVAHLDGELRSERQSTEGERIARERLTRQIAQKDEQVQRARTEAQTVAARRAGAERELTQKTSDVDALSAELGPARQELSQLESRERSMTGELAESNAALRTAERALVDAENDMRVRRDELEALQESLQTEGFVATAAGDIERVREPEAETTAESERAAEGAYVSSNGDLPAWMRSDDEDGDGLAPMRGGSTINPVEVRDRIAELRGQIRGLGPINEEAATEYADSRERYDFLTGQTRDLQQAEEQLQSAIAELEVFIRDRFRNTFKLVNKEFERYFNAFFRGGTARLELGEADEYGLPGVEIIAQPPGKKLGSLALLSGGERSLTAVALLFALLQANPSPICVLDEVDAALDEANVGRFVEELRALSERTQFIIITHNRRTIETADTIYGVSMAADNVSRILSLRLEDVPQGDD